MTTKRFLLLATVLAALNVFSPAQAQVFLDCNCLASQSVLMTNACQAVIPDLCLFANCVKSTVVPTPPYTCSQSPAAGGVVGPGTYPITVTILDSQGLSSQCVLNFTVNAPASGCTPCIPQTNIWNSGMGGNGAMSLPAGTPDPNYVFVSGPPGGCTGPAQVLLPGSLPGAWLPNGPNSQWIGAGPTANCEAGIYHYRLCFYLPCTDGAAILGQWSADDWGEILINGQPTGHTIPSVQFPNLTFATWHPVAITNGFVCGNNCLDFYVTNANIGVNPTGFRAELTNVFNDCCCTPPQPVFSVVSGMDPAGGALPIGTPDNSFALTCAPAGVSLTTPVTVTPHSLWLPNGPNSQWIGVDPSNFGPPGVYCYTLHFNIPCPPGKPINASLTGQWTADDWAELHLNGLPTGHTVPSVQFPGISFGGWHPINITSGFQSGLNTLTFYVTNAGGPTGMRLELAASASCCDCTNSCAPVPVLTLNSGRDANGPLPGGSLDPQFNTGAPLFTTPNPYVPMAIHPFWLPNTAVSEWVSPLPGLSGAPVGNYFYTNRFFLCSTNQAMLTGRWAGDDSGDIRLNGGPPGNFLPAGFAFASWTPVSLMSGLVPGWNELVFRITNSVWGSVTGLRTEISGTACCNNCVVITCPANQTRTNCPPGGTVTYPAPAATSGCGAIVSLSCTPASGSLFPLGTNTVTCTAIDSAGNAAMCSFTVTMRPAAPPVTIMCPPNQTIPTCGITAVAYYKVKAMGQTGPVVCAPASGSTFPPGTNVVTCTATNLCGQSASCSFLVIVINHLLGPPALTITAGIPDNFALPVEPSPPSACMIAAFSGFPLWKGFDAVFANTLFGHRFTGLPNNVAKAELVVHMKPTSGSGAVNDGIFVGLPTCLFSSFRWSASIAALPGAGGNWNPGHPATTFTFNLGLSNAAILSDINSQGYLDVVVHDDTTVDYMQLRLWRCPPPSPGIGVPFDVVGGATTALRPAPGPGLPLPAICVFPNPNLPSGVLLQPGAAKTISFTTVLDFEAAEGAGIDLVLPPDPRNPNGMPFLSFHRKSGPKGYCVKTSKLYDDEPDISYRSIAIGTNGDLLPSVVWDAANIETNVLLWLNYQPGVTSVVMTVTLDLETREASLEFPHCIWTPVNGRKGWDGCIYGNGTPSKGSNTNKTARLILTPAPPHTPLPPVFELSLLATGLSEMLVEDPEIETMGRKWGDGHVTLMKAYDDGETERLSFITVGQGGGVHTDLGNAAAFSIGFHHFENGDIPDEEQVFRLTGPIRGLTNRPAPPQIPLRLAEGPDGVHCTVDFSDLAAESITVQLWNNGVLVGQGSEEGAAIQPEAPLIIDRWPDRIGRPAINQGYLALTSGEPFLVSGIMGDELRFIPGLPPGMEFPEYFSRLECETRDGMDNLLYGLQRTLACPPTALNITRDADGIVITWPDHGYRLQGAEAVTGPWYDLGARAPVSLGPSHPARFFKLICD